MERSQEIQAYWTHPCRGVPSLRVTRSLSTGLETLWSPSGWAGANSLVLFWDRWDSATRSRLSRELGDWTEALKAGRWRGVVGSCGWSRGTHGPESQLNPLAEWTWDTGIHHWASWMCCGHQSSRVPPLDNPDDVVAHLTLFLSPISGAKQPETPGINTWSLVSHWRLQYNCDCGDGHLVQALEHYDPGRYIIWSYNLKEDRWIEYFNPVSVFFNQHF